jgi:hypothetical protein
MEWFSDYFAARFKAFFGAFVVAFVPTLITAFETSFSIDIPGTWETGIQNWILALLAGLTINYVANKPAPPKA